MDIFKKVFNGDERLVITFWVWGFLGSIIYGFVTGFILAMIGLGSPIVVTLVSLVYSVFIWVGVWRSSDKYQGQKIWALLAKVAVGLGVVFTVYNFFNPISMPGM